MSKGENGQRYEVHCSGAVASDLYQLQGEAGTDLKKHIAAAFKEIVRKLQVDAKDCGEPLYRLPIMRMEVRTMALAPLAIVFALCEDRPLVFIKSCRLLAGA